MNTINLNCIKQYLIKLENCPYEEKKQFRQITKDYIKEVVEKSCNVFIEDIKIKRDRNYGFFVYTISKLTDDKEYINFTYISHNNSCRIVYNGKFEINIKL